MLDKIENEMKLWDRYYKNDEVHLVSILADILACMTPEDREKNFNNVKESLVDLKSPISIETAIQSIEADIEAYKQIKSESGIAYRTLAWVKDEFEKENGSDNVQNVQVESEIEEK